MCEVEKVPNYCKRVRFEGKKERCVHSPRKERDEHVIINDSFFLGRTRDDAPPQSKGRERESTNRAQTGSRQKQSNGKARERCGVSRGSPETPPRRALFLGKILLRKILPSSAVPFLERRVVVDARRGRRGRARTDEDEDETMRGRSRWARTTTSSTHSARG